MSNTPSEPIPSAGTPEPKFTSEEPAPAAKTPKNFASLTEEAIDLESEFEELDGLTPERKIEEVHRLTLRKRLRRLELDLEAAIKKTESAERLKTRDFDMAGNELNRAKLKLTTFVPLRGVSISELEYKQQETEVEIAEHKVAKLQQERGDLKDEVKEASERVQRLRKKMDDILKVQKPAPEVTY
jgi:FtsZ-binding cell division protein ZapB